MERKSFAPHESLDLHEVINFKTLCVAKSKLMQGLVFDEDLKKLMQKDVEQSIQALSELQEAYKDVPFAAEIPQMRPTPIIGGEEGVIH
ncbi:MULTISPECIES: spore gernimation protein GerQ [Niallia]|jgi:similar to spore coat protein|uniref:Spore gernimation protein GerQ n=1 Tax=Niallia circulans TaxID=1397 RepID=A0A268FI78_NIACI|nr:spore gernimation protein GerQ [Niallia circulans]AYV66392.1 spore gernimation protein GerQ [Niallia circulans]AYV70790.1 spore gernimation protein GerQ [Niallia circulans]PAD85082.1 spore gernimation protein GerQ [Niallia circulans]QJX62282.1 spore gernimation protein GerQ [Niallia circulans]UQZ73170.1 spore gernimation protein GerQ [Niallia circulans]